MRVSEFTTIMGPHVDTGDTSSKVQEHFVELPGSNVDTNSAQRDET